MATLPNGDFAIFLTDLVTFLTSLPRPYICLADSRSMIPPSYGALSAIPPPANNLKLGEKVSSSSFSGSDPAAL